MKYIKQYQIDVDGLTKGGLALPSGWLLTIIAVSKENDKHLLVVQTCIVSGSPPENVVVNQYENIPDGGVCSYAYAVPGDNAKTENLVIKNNFEADLDTWFGAGNWQEV